MIYILSASGKRWIIIKKIHAPYISLLQNTELATMHGVSLFKEFVDKKTRRKPEVNYIRLLLLKFEISV